MAEMLQNLSCHGVVVLCLIPDLADPGRRLDVSDDGGSGDAGGTQ